MALSEIRDALTGLSGALPRRAVVAEDGSLVDKLTRPDRPESVQLSMVCEIMRREAQEPVFSRYTPVLLAQCLKSNDPCAWRAMLDDATTADLDMACMATFWAAAMHAEDGEQNRMDALVGCLVASTSGMHTWLVVRAIQHIIPVLDAEATARLASAFQAQFTDVIKTVSRRAKDISVDMRAGIITALGKLIVWCNIPVADMCGMLGVAIRTGIDDVLRLFTFAPMSAMVDHEPSLVDRLVLRAERSSQASKFPACALLAVMTREQLEPFADRVLGVVQRTLDTAAAQGCMDSKLALVCGVLARTASPHLSLQASLAHALCCMSLSTS